MNVLTLIPIHNRKAITLMCLHALHKMRVPDNVNLKIVVIDDGSKDGSAAAIAEIFPNVEIIFGSGNLYWSGSILFAIRELGLNQPENDVDYLWLVNDDTMLDELCLLKQLQASLRNGDRITTATIYDDEDNVIYGGIVACKHFRFKKVDYPKKCDADQVVDAVNGNSMLIPIEIIQKIDWHLVRNFVHDGLDMYISLYASRLEKNPIIASGARGFGDPNAEKFWYYSRKTSLRKRLAGVISPKGVYPKMYLTLCREFAGPLWFLYFWRPYVLAFIGRDSAVRRKLG